MRIGASALFAIAALASPAPASPEGAPAAKPAEPIPVDDFEAPALRPAWKTYRAKMSLVQGANGQALEVVADEGSSETTFSSVTVTLPVKDLRTVGAVSFQFLAGGMRSVQVLLRKDGTSRSLEEVMVPSAKWQAWGEHVLPLRHMIEGSLGLLPDPADLDVLEFRWEGPGTIRLDDIKLLPGDRGDASWKISEEDLLELAFGKGRGQIQRGKHFSVLWESDAVAKEEVTRALRDMEQLPALLSSRWSLETPPGTRIPIFCAANHGASNDLRSNVLANFRAYGPLPSRALDRGIEPYVTTSPGGLKGSGKKPGTEGLPLLVCRALGVGETSALGDALYWACIRRLSPGSVTGNRDIEASDFQGRLQGRKGRILAWGMLFDGRMSYENPGQLASVVEFLAANHKPKLKAVWEEIRALQGDPDEGTPGAIAKALGKSVLDLQEDWIRWGAANWK